MVYYYGGKGAIAVYIGQSVYQLFFFLFQKSWRQCMYDIVDIQPNHAY